MSLARLGPSSSFPLSEHLLSAAGLCPRNIMKNVLALCFSPGAQVLHYVPLLSILEGVIKLLDFSILEQLFPSFSMDPWIGRSVGRFVSLPLFLPIKINESPLELPKEASFQDSTRKSPVFLSKALLLPPFLEKPVHRSQGSFQNF